MNTFSLVALYALIAFVVLVALRRAIPGCLLFVGLWAACVLAVPTVGMCLEWVGRHVGDRGRQTEDMAFNAGIVALISLLAVIFMPKASSDDVRHWRLHAAVVAWLVVGICSLGVLVSISLYRLGFS